MIVELDKNDLAIQTIEKLYDDIISLGQKQVNVGYQVFSYIAVSKHVRNDIMNSSMIEGYVHLDNGTAVKLDNDLGSLEIV